MDIDLTKVFSGEGFPARWNCGQAWTEEPIWGWMHIIGDLVIWGAYFAIPILLFVIVGGRAKLPFPRLLILFASFILLCGLTHLIDAAIFYWPLYRLNAIVKVITGLVSLATVVVLSILLPKVLRMRGIDDLEMDLQKAAGELQQISKQLRVSRSVLDFALESAHAGVFLFDVTTHEFALDPASLKLLGVRLPGNSIGLSDFRERICKFGPEFEDLLGKAAEVGQAFSARYAFKHPVKGQVWINCEAKPLKDTSGEVKTVVGFQKDISEQIRIEDELDQSAQQAYSASQQKSKYIAQVSHEIRTPLTALLGILDLCLDGQMPEDLRSELTLVRSQGELLRMLVNDVLDLAKIELGRLEIRPRATNLHSLTQQVQKLVNPLVSEKSLQLIWNFQVDESDFHAICDADRIKQVLINLINNAIKFTETGCITVDSCINDEQIVFTVSDTGIGIPPHHLTKVFDEYEQGSSTAEGTGLGLSICKHLCQLMDGDIKIESVLHEGTKVRFWLPYRRASTVDCEAQSTPTGVALNLSLPIRVLLAEDTRALQFLMTRLLSPKVQELYIANDGIEALSKFSKFQSQNRDFDLIILDIQMPNLDGKKTAQRLRQLGYNGKLVAFSAGVLTTEREDCFSAGFDAFLQKPIDQSELMQLLSQFA